MKLSIVIPNYNGRDLLAECLPAVKAAIRRAGLAGEAEIIVADDASTDDSLDWLARTHYDVIAVGSRRNRGFAATANAGIAAACGEWIALLNNDTAVDRDWIVAAANHFDNPKVGSIATRVVFYDQDQTIESAGDTYTVVGVPGKFGRGKLAASASAPGVRFSACGAAAFYRSAALAQVGTFYEQLSAYYEDVELGFRLNLTGWDCIYEPASICRHKESVTYGKMSFKKKYLSARNLEIVYFTCMPAGALLRLLPAKLLALCLHFIYRIWIQDAASFLVGKTVAAGMLWRIAARRRAVQAARRVDADEVIKKMDPHWIRTLVMSRVR